MKAISLLILISFHNVYGLFSTRIGYGINNGPQTHTHNLDDIGNDNNWQDQWGGMKVRLY
jgi:lysosomal Pro-X carboxypeptidase